MIEPDKILGYLRGSCRVLLEQGTLGVKRWPLRPTQREALVAYTGFLDRTDLTAADKLTGYFEIPTGVGKTALFGALIDEAKALAAADGVALRVGIVAPRTNLLTQTRNEIEGLNPKLASDIGVYGGSERVGDRPVTIITYDSWSNLTDRGELTVKDFDLLIADEAHRGTSVAREQRLTEHYNGIAQLAFTATAHFDDEKTVVKTHRNKIFEKHISASVRESELAAYIQTQFFVLRVAPERAAKDKSVSNRLIRQVAFNKLVEIQLVTGIDQYTGDRLTDNQGAIYVADTAQADLLAKKLNANPELQRRAEEHGCEAFAVSIHSVGIDGGEQEKRERDYKAGKYLFIVGDDKFKEGFDHPPMKTVLDMPHVSLVDKAQILGRGARRWYNSAKRRQEGLTFIETLIYVGSADSAQNEKLLNAMLSRATFANDILDGSAQIIDPTLPPPRPPIVFPPIDGPGPKELPPEPPPILILPPPVLPPPKGGLPVPPPIVPPPIVPPPPPKLIDTGLTVTGYDTPEQIKTFLSQREKARAEEPVIENWPESAEYQSWCELHKRKGSPGGRVLLKAATLDEEEAGGLFGQGHSIIGRIIRGDVQEVTRPQYEALILLIEAMPGLIANWPQSEEYRTWCELHKRKGSPGGKALLKAAKQDKEARGLFGKSPSILERIIYGESSEVTRPQYAALIQLTEAMPEMIVNWPQSEEYRTWCELHKRKGSPGGMVLLKAATQDEEEIRGLFGKVSQNIDNIIRGIIQEVTRPQYAALIRLTEAMPEMIVNWPQSEEYRTWCELHKRKGSPWGEELLKAATKDEEEIRGLFGESSQVVNYIINGKKQEVTRPQYAALIRLAQAMPEMIVNWPQSEEYRTWCELHKRKGSPGGKELLKAATQDEEARGLFGNSPHNIDKIIKGIIQEVTRPQYAALIRLIESMPEMIVNWPQSTEYKRWCELHKRKGSPGGEELLKAVTQDEEARGLFGKTRKRIDRIIKGIKQDVTRPQYESLTRLLEAMPDKVLAAAAKEVTKPQVDGLLKDQKRDVVRKQDVAPAKAKAEDAPEPVARRPGNVRPGGRDVLPKRRV